MGEECDPAELGLAYARALCKELSALIGVEVTVKGPSIDYLERADVLDSEFPVGHTLSQAADDASQKIHLLMPRADAATLAALMMGQDEASVKEARESPLEGDLLETYTEVMNLGVTVLSRVFSSDFGLSGIESQGTQEIGDPRADQVNIEGDEFMLARHRVIVPGFDAGRLDVLFPLDVAELWFGVRSGGSAESSSAQESEADGRHGDPAEADVSSLVIIDASAEDRQQAEDLEDDLDTTITVLGPEEIDPDDLEELLEAGAFFVDWDLGVRSGVDVLETLRSDERLSGKPVLMASASPTAAMVEMALAAGAAGFVHKPYRADEMKRRLAPLLASRAGADESAE